MTAKSLRRTAIAAAAAIAVVIVTLRTPGSPPAVPHLDVVNRSEYTVTVRVNGADRDGAVYLGSAQKQATTRFEAIADQGPNWRFRAAAQGAEAGEWAVSRLQLERAGWRVVIPPQIAEHLRRLGLPPTP